MLKDGMHGLLFMGECLYAGKVKQVWSTDDPDILEFRYTNHISVFDQIIPSLIPRKGESLNRTTCHWFKLVEEEGICQTHIVERNASDRCLVRKVEVYREPGTVPRDAEWVFVPLEVVCRHYLAGSGWRRYQKGELSAEELGFEAGEELQQGVKLPRPCLEVTTKFEEFDRLIDRELLESMKRGAILINTSRGAIVDECALLDSLNRGQMGGAGLDVLTGEPDISANPLVEYAKTHDNLLISPHCGGYSRDAVKLVCRRAAEKIVDYFQRIQ